MALGGEWLSGLRHSMDVNGGGREITRDERYEQDGVGGDEQVVQP